MPFDPVETARRISAGLDEDETRESPRDIARRIAGLPPEEEEEGLDLLQPVRTFFGGSQGIGGKAVGALAPEAYEAASGELREAFGVEEGGPWYEDVEALPGAGDVLAHLVPEETREGLVGRAVGPALRMAGNIALDPTTYVGGVMGKLATKAAASVEGGAVALSAAKTASKGRRLALRSGAITKDAARAADLKDASRIADLVLSKGSTAQKAAYRGGIGMATGGPLAMGVGAAAAYGPEAVQAAMEGARRTYEAEGIAEKAAEAANAALMTGLSALMAKGVIDAATAGRAYTRHLKDTKQIPDVVERAETGLADEAGVPRMAEPEAPLAIPEPEPLTIPDDVPPVEVPTDVPPVELPPDAQLRLQELGYTPADMAMMSEDDVARVLEGEVPPVREERLPEAEILPEPEVLPEAEIIPEPLPEAQIVDEPVRLPEAEVLPEAAAPVAVEPLVAAPDAPTPEAAPREAPATPTPPEAPLIPEKPATTTEVVEPQKVTEPEAPKPEPSAQPAEPIPEKPPEKPVEPAPEAPPEPQPITPEKPVEAPVEPPTAPDAVREVWDNKGFQKAFDSQLRKEQIKGGDSPMERVQEGMINSPEFQSELADGLAALKAKGDYTPGQLMGLVRRIANQKTPKGGYRFAIKAQELGAGGGSVKGEAPLATATETAEAAGKGKKAPLKEKQRERGGTVRFSTLKEAVEARGEKLKDFVYKSTTFKALKKQHKDIWVEYQHQMERGISRAEAVKNTKKAFEAQALAPRTIANVIGRAERSFMEEVGGKKKDKASPETVKELKRLQKEAVFPKRAAKQDAASFAEAMKGDKREVSLALGRFLEFTQKRTEAGAGVPKALRSMAPLKKFATDLGVKVAPHDDALALVARIAKTTGLDPTVFPKYMRELETAAAGKNRTGPLKLEGFKATRRGWEHPNGLKVSPIAEREGGFVLKIDAHGKDADEIADALRPALEDPRIDAIDISDAKRIGGENPVQDAMDRLGLEAGDPPERYVPPKRAEAMSTRMDTFVKEFLPLSVDDYFTGNRISDELATRNFAVKLGRQLKDKGIQLDYNDPAAERAMGLYHRVYDLNATAADGTKVVLRVGRAPSFAYPTEAQRGLVMPIIAKGKLYDDLQPMYYTVHPEMRTVPYNEHTLPRYDRTALLTSSDPILKSMNRADLQKEFTESLAQRIELEQTVHLPEGMGLAQNLDSTAELLAKAQRAGLIIDDMTHGPGKVRWDQMGWIPEKNPTGDMVTWTDANGQAWRLVFSDYGTVFPNPETRAGTIWSVMEQNPTFDTVRLSLKELEPESKLSLADQLRRIDDYETQLKEAEDIGDGLVNANMDNLADPKFVSRHSELGGGAARGLRRVVEDLRDTINARDDVKPFEGKVDVEYAGLTSSPHLSGLHLEEAARGKGRVLSNVVEAVNAGADYDDAVDMALHTVIHEVAHNKGKGHEFSFQTMENYIKNLADAEGKMDQYRQWVKESFPREQYDAIRSELVPEFKRMRNEYGGRESWRAARIERLPVGTTEGGATPRAGRGGRGAEAAARGIKDGVRPRSALQRGTQEPTGRVRQAAAADQPAAQRRAEGEATGPRTRRGTEGAEAEYQELVSRVDTFFAREGAEGGPKDVAEAKRFLDDLMSIHKKDKPLAEVHDAAWKMAELLHPKLTQADKDALRKTLPRPRRGDQGPGVFNMLNNPEISDAIKERTVLYTQLLPKGVFKRDVVRKWSVVDDSVKELLGIDTPENWTLAFRNKGGGLRDHEVLLLRQIHTELANKIDYQERRLADAVAAGDEQRTISAQRDLHKANRSYHHAGLNLANGLTNVARALAIGRKKVRALDPKLAWEADLKAGLRERMRTRFKDPVIAEEKAGELFNKMMKIVDDPDGGDWGEFYRAYRAMMGSKLWPDKVLEFYKAGLLGWPSRVANLTSNALFRGVRYVEDAVAGALDATQTKLTGAKREVYAGEVGVSALALRRAMAEAFPKWTRDNQRAFMLDPQDFRQAIKQGSLMEDLMMHPGAIEGKKGEFIRFQLKGLGADDELAKHFSRMDTYYRSVYRKVRNGEYAKREGESNVHATERIATDLRDNFNAALEGSPHDPAKLKQFQPIAEEADRIAKADTFQTDLGNAGKGFQSLLREAPALQVFFPFVRTPTNIAKETIKRTPLGLIKVAKDWDGLTQAQKMSELSKPMTGTALGLGIMGMAMTGDITGGGPVDFNDRETLINAGWAPYSIRLGDQWVSFQRFEPIAAILGIAADAAEGVRNGDFDSFHTGTLKVLQSSAENVTNKTFMSGMDALFSAISNPKQALGRFTKQMQTSVIPNSLGFVPVGHMARAIDGTYRQTEPMTMDVFYSKIPMLSQTLTPQYTPTGEERKRASSAAERLISPFARRSVEDGPAAWGAEEVVRVDAAPQPPKRYWYGRGGVKVAFNQEEKQLFAKALAKATNVIGTKVIKDPSYLRLPDDEQDPRYRYGRRTKQETIRRIYQKYRSAAMKQIRKGVESRARQVVREQSGG